MRGVNRVSQLSDVLVWLCAGSGRQVGWKPQWLRSYRVFCRECKHANRPEIPRLCRLQPTRNLAAYLIAYKPRPGGQETRLGEGFAAIRCAGFGLCAGPHGFSVIAGLIAAKPGLKGLRRLGAEGFRSYQM